MGNLVRAGGRPTPKWAAPIRSRPNSHNHCAEVLARMEDRRSVSRPAERVISSEGRH